MGTGGERATLGAGVERVAVSSSPAGAARLTHRSGCPSARRAPRLNRSYSAPLPCPPAVHHTTQQHTKAPRCLVSLLKLLKA